MAEHGPAQPQIVFEFNVFCFVWPLKLVNFNNQILANDTKQSPVGIFDSLTLSPSAAVTFSISPLIFGKPVQVFAGIKYHES